jgi:hypothetical protein
MENMKTKKIKRTAELCLWCLGNGAIGFLLATLGFAFAVAFCHIFGLDTSWANSIL